jgi:phosphoglycerate dehydrogenase-like enzyme
MDTPVKIAILDDDHVIRLARYALGSSEITDQWARDFFLPESMDLTQIRAVGRGLGEADGVRLVPASEKLDLRQGSDVSILIFRRGTIDAALMDANPKLKLIQRIGGRSDGIDLKAAAERNILVSCVPRRTLHYTAEHAILLMLALSKRLIEADAAVRKGEWDHDKVHPEHGVAYNWIGMSRLGGLFGKTVGIIGLGEVGAIAAGIAKSFGARVVYANRRRLPAEQEKRDGLEYRPVPELLAQADFVSLHANNVPENKGLIGASAFAQMKPSAYFINTSRGRMVDEDALYEALTQGVIAGAGLDVHYDEPRPGTNRFGGLRNAILTPHLAGGSRKTVLDEIDAILSNARALLAGQPIEYQVR